ncbi:MAG: hypothetical protein E7K06_09935 [Corynebacterium sp.]|uniref:hypothetical protein n=1 Tax=Corynebacterium TaxID=1716 RepID=UPI001EF39CDE|nr:MULTISPECIES: hypothetical protein [Corynebacterium]MCG7450174.1 hypothetical protein [Corynebacterium kefirresidentii]MCG7452085.1 hypothetical protein [Corynebacterium kefirresidentii]MDN8633920.1 hypothetical protein [Corynebacterium kefirresidentii]MDU3166236.1 hypothetical protein [Corynebacterium sp.]MDU4633122.1 hypothetical protein [Corynebacterium sp.]
MSNPYSNNDSFNSGNNGPGTPGPASESAPYGNGANGQPGYGQQYSQQQFGQPGYAGSTYQGEDSPIGRDVDAIQVIADSFRYFGRNWAQWIFGPLVQMVVLSILYLLLVAVLAGSGTSIDALAKSGSGSDALTGGLIAVMFLAIIAMFLVFIWAASTWYKAANKQVDTGMLEIKDFLSFKNVAGLMAVYVLSTLVISLGFILLIIPGLFAAFFFTWMPAVKAARPELSVGETFGASIEVAKENVGVTILVAVLIAVLYAVLSFTFVGMLLFPALNTLILVLFVRRTLGLRG